MVDGTAATFTGHVQFDRRVRLVIVKSDMEQYEAMRICLISSEISGHVLDEGAEGALKKSEVPLFHPEMYFALEWKAMTWSSAEIVCL